MKKILCILILIALLAASAWAVDFGAGIKTGAAYQVLYGAMFFVGGSVEVLVPLANAGGVGAEIDFLWFAPFGNISYDYFILPILIKSRIPAKFGYFTFGVGPEVIVGAGTTVAFHLLAGFAFNAGPGYFIFEFRGSTDFDAWTWRDYIGGILGYTFEF